MRLPRFCRICAALPLASVALAGTPPVELFQEPPHCARAYRPGVWLPSPGGIALVTRPTDEHRPVAYIAGYDRSEWSGTLRKMDVVTDVQGAMHLKQAEWDAGDSSRLPFRPLERKIYTWLPETGETVPFQWQRLSHAQRSALDRLQAGARADGLGTHRLDWLRGERALETGFPGGRFRERRRLLGDIVNSNPVHVAGSRSLHGRGETAPAGVKDAIYVGTNGGIVHAFDAAYGNELFAYVPNAVFPALSRLSAPAYRHRPYVDGGLASSPAVVSGRRITVLAGALGGGGQALFALDVSDPERFDATGGVLFEFSDADDADLGNLIGPPAIVKMHLGARDGRLRDGYFLLATSGVNNDQADGGARYNRDGAAALFLLSLDKPAGSRWKLGENYYKWRLPVPQGGTANGLGPAALLAGPDGTLRRVYVGDLQGRLWRFDFAGGPPWRQALGKAIPLFVARDPSGKPQAISVAPRIAHAAGGHLLLFGTGKYLEARDADPAAFSVQSFYAVFDSGLPKHAIAGREELEPRFLPRSDVGSAQQATFLSSASGRAHRKGWYFDLPDAQTAGERVISQALLADGIVYFNSLIPGADPCALKVRSYAFRLGEGAPLSGFPLDDTPASGIFGPPIMIESGAAIGHRNAIGARIVERERRRLVMPSDETPAEPGPDAGRVRTFTRAGRLSWREIPNWKELHDAAGGQ